VIRHFPAKFAKYLNFHVIKATAAIWTKFCTAIKTSKYSLWEVSECTPQIQDGGQPPFWKMLNAVFPKPFDRFWWNLVWWWHWPSQPNWLLKVWNFENPTQWHQTKCFKTDYLHYNSVTFCKCGQNPKSGQKFVWSWISAEFAKMAWFQPQLVL